MSDKGELRMHIDVPLNKLRFGHEDGAGINARVTGRDDGIAALAANLYAQGQIEDLIVKPCGDGFYSVANGNRRLKAFQKIYGDTSDHLIGCTLHEVDEARAFEFSLTTAVTAAQLHPIDQYEAFARLKERRTDEEIAAQYGLTEKQVRQALALGYLSPTVRAAWRDGTIKAEEAKAFTLGRDHKVQDKAFAKLQKTGRLWQSAIREELGALKDDLGELLNFVGVDEYRRAGGEVTEDLFGSRHVISDDALLRDLATTKFELTLQQLRDEGWSWAELASNLPQGARWWSKIEPKKLDYEDGEQDRVNALKASIAEINTEEEDSTEYSEDFDLRREPLVTELEAIEARVARRSFTDKQKARSGVIVEFEDGALHFIFGQVRPEERKPVPTDEKASKAGKGAAAPSQPEEPAISNALTHRLTVQLTKGAATALMQDPDLALCVLLAGTSSSHDSGVKISISGLNRDAMDYGTREFVDVLAGVRKLTAQQRNEMVAQYAAAALDFQNQPLDKDLDRSDHGPRAICNALDPAALNAALRGAFDATDYFGGVNKALCLKAIEEACGPDLAQQQEKNSKADIVAFAIENVPPTGWLPPPLRAKGYDGPPAGKPKLTAKPVKAAVKAKAKSSVRKKVSRRPAVKPATKKKAASKKRKAG